MAAAARDEKMTRLEQLRPLGALEKYSALRHYHGWYNGLAVTAYYVPPPSVASLPRRGLLYMALRKLLIEHPMLSCVPVGESTNSPYFARLPHIDFDAVVSFRILANETIVNDWDATIDSIIEAEHNTPFKKPSLPVWRIVVSSAPGAAGFWLTWVLHPALGDAKSGFIFHQALLRKLNFLSSNSSSAAAVAGAVAMVPSVVVCLGEQAAGVPFSLPLELIRPATPVRRNTAFKSLVVDLLDRPQKRLWTGSAHKVPLKTCFRSLEVAADVAAALVRACRKERTTVTAALQVVVAGAVLEVLKDYDKLTVVGSLDMRKWLRETDVCKKTIGCYIGQFHEEYTKAWTTGRDAVWPEARRSRGTILEVLQKRGETDSALGSSAMGYEPLSKARIGQRRTAGLEVSNVGVFDPESWRQGAEADGGWYEESTEGWRIERVMFSQSADVVGSALMCNVASIKDGPMSLCFSWQTGVVADADAEKIISRTEKRILEIARVRKSIG